MHNPPIVSFPWNVKSTIHSPLHLSATLDCGQSFRWRRDAQGIWWGAVGASVIAAWQPEEPDAPLYWQTFPQQNDESRVIDYFRLNVDLLGLTERWIRAEPSMAHAAQAFHGLRILRQPPEETLFAFQCAACNTVVKIERSVRALAARYGERIEIGLPDAPFEFYRFPTAAELAQAEEAALRADLWGYRAPRVIAVARELAAAPEGWLEGLREAPHAEARAALKQFFGIGTKIADCICLFALDKDEAVPVDTHVRQIACRLFVPEMAQKTLTDRVYEAISSAYRERFGEFAGWAQQYLFFGELRRSAEYAGSAGSV
jgi:N-glycosylase/DNA lyase